MCTEHSGPPGQLNSARKKQFSEHGASREHTAARLPGRLLQALENAPPHTGEMLSVQTLPAGDLASQEKTGYNKLGVLVDAKMRFKRIILETNLSSSAP